jgi:hypothetical protein
MKKLLIAFPLLVSSALVISNSNPASAAPFTQCPAIGAAAGCNLLITINPDGSVDTDVDSTQPPYDNFEDQLVGVQNNFNQIINSISLTGSGIFGFDGDGLATFPPHVSYGPTGYEGPNTSFTITDINHGIVNFLNGIAPSQSAYFSLEEAAAANQITTTGISTTPTTPVPEPASTLGLFALGAMGATSALKRKKGQNTQNNNLK